MVLLYPGCGLGRADILCLIVAVLFDDGQDVPFLIIAEPTGIVEGHHQSQQGD